MPEPIKRHKALQPLSREHHHGLLLSWKIREGLKRNIETDRIQKYAAWFFKHQLLPHFEMEEEHVFPLLGNDHEFVQQALTEHRRLKELFRSTDKTEEHLRRIEEDLVGHIRFEERVLFNEIQDVATESQLQLLEDILQDNPVCEPWEDEFWK